MKRWNAFLAVCGHLRAGLLGGAPLQAQDDTGWELLAAASSHHYVTPALAWCLRDRPDVPVEARDYLATILALNGKRNAVLLASLKRVVAACNAIGIEPVPLKGAARLLAGDYPAPSLRFLGDLDVLIPAERSADALAALTAIGFAARADDEPVPPAHNHLPMLHDREAGGGVELHTDVLKHDSAKIIATDWFWVGTRPAAFQDLRIRLPDATRSVGHIIAHDQIHHGGYAARRVELRQVLDVALIRAGHEQAIDWALLDHRFCRHGFGVVLSTYLAVAEVLFGQLAPRLSSAPRLHALAHLRSTVEASRWQRLALIAMDYAAARRRDPLGVVQLLNWHTWAGRVRMVMKAFDHRPRGW